RDIALGDLPDATPQDLDRRFVTVQPAQLTQNRLHRALDVDLEHDVQLFSIGCLEPAIDVLERDAPAAALPGLFSALSGNLTGFPIVLHNLEALARRDNIAQAHDLDRLTRWGFLHSAPV